MADRSIDSLQDLEALLKDFLEKTHQIEAEVLVLKILTPHLMGLLVRKAENPEKYFQDIRATSRENLAEGVVIEGDETEADRKVLKMALERHDQMFEEMRRALGFREETTH